jgi:hypothetical protein
MQDRSTISMPVTPGAFRSADAPPARPWRLGVRGVIGVLLLLPAVTLAGLAIEEWRLDAQSQQQFSLTAIDGDAAYRFGGATVTVTVAMDAPRSADRAPLVAIRVNGRPVTQDVPGRYAAYLVERRSDGWRRLVVAQNVSGHVDAAAPQSESVSRLLWVDADGNVVEELARAHDWFRSPLSTRLMRYVVPHALGYRSNVLWAEWLPRLRLAVGGLAFFGVALLLQAWPRNARARASVLP